MLQLPIIGWVVATHSIGSFVNTGLPYTKSNSVKVAPLIILSSSPNRFPQVLFPVSVAPSINLAKDCGPGASILFLVANAICCRGCVVILKGARSSFVASNFLGCLLKASRITLPSSLFLRCLSERYDVLRLCNSFCKS